MDESREMKDLLLACIRHDEAEMDRIWESSDKDDLGAALSTMAVETLLRLAAAHGDTEADVIRMLEQ